jgi:hypothetical protein
MCVDEIETRAHKNSDSNTLYFRRYKNDTALYTVLSFSLPCFMILPFLSILKYQVFGLEIFNGCLPIASIHMPSFRFFAASKYILKKSFHHCNTFYFALHMTNRSKVAEAGVQKQVVPHQDAKKN